MKRLILLPLLFISMLGFSQVDTLLGYKGKLKIDTALTIDGNYLFTPSRNHISFDSSKLIWFLNGSKVYTGFTKVAIGTQNPQSKFYVSDSTATELNDSTGIMLANDTTGISPALTFSSKALNSSTGLWQKARFFLSSKTLSTNPLASTWNLRYSVNGAAYGTPLFSVDYGGNGVFSGKLTVGGSGSSFGTLISSPQVFTTNIFLGSGASSSVFAINNTTSFPVLSGTNNSGGLLINQTISTGGGTNTFKGVYFNPIIAAMWGTKLTGFQNEIGDNKFNSTQGGLQGSSGFGVANTDSINGSAMVELKTTTKGFLLPRLTKAQRNGIISSITGSTTNAGTAYTANAGYINVPLTGGSGTGATANIKMSGTTVGAIYITSLGSGYVAGDVLSEATLPNGGTRFQYTISAVGNPATGLMIYQTDNTQGLRVFNGTNWMRYTETAD